MNREPMNLRPVVVCLVLVLTGCTSFGAARSADVLEGPAGALSLALATPPGDDAAWFWSFDCAASCNRTISSWEVSYSHGFAAHDGAPIELGIGVNGLLFPYVQGYVQLNASGQNPYGVGARLGLPAMSNWTQHQIFARFDRPRPNGDRLLFNPSIFLHTGRSPNGENPGSMLAFIPSIGWYVPKPNLSMVFTASPVIGWTRRESYGTEHSSFTAFLSASVTVIAHSRQE